MRRRAMTSLMLAAAVLATAGSAVAADMWLHVRVDEQDGARVKVNLPITMIEKALAMVPEEHLHDGVIHIDALDNHMSATEMRELWTEIKNGPDMTYVTVEESDETVKIWKESGYLRVHVRELDDEEVSVRVPLTVMDALLSGGENELDVEAAVAALAQQGEGELVTVTGRDESVRIWVDQIAEAD